MSNCQIYTIIGMGGVLAMVNCLERMILIAMKYPQLDEHSHYTIQNGIG